MWDTTVADPTRSEAIPTPIGFLEGTATVPASGTCIARCGSPGEGRHPSGQILGLADLERRRNRAEAVGHACLFIVGDVPEELGHLPTQVGQISRS